MQPTRETEVVQDTTVEKVTGKKGVKEFIRFPWTVYRDDPLWVPPLIKEQTVMFSPAYPFFEHGEIDLFIARQGDRPVGRIASILDRSYVEFSREKAAFFGFFESIKETQVARLLIDRVRAWGRDRGMTVIRGPFNPSTNDECGLLIKGFDMPPMLMMPYNPPYYPELMEACGLKKCKDLYACIIASDAPPEKIERVSGRIRKRLPGLTIRPVRLSRLGEELEIVRDIYNDAWRENWGFVPITESEMRFMASRLKPLVIPDLFLFAEIKGEPVAFIGSFPDYNRVLRRLNGKIGLTGILKFLYYSRKIKDLRTMLLGVKHGYQKRGLETLLYLETFRRGLRRGFKRSELSWILEDNRLMLRGVERLGGTVYKTYRLYEGTTS
ncbi:MAG: N-acetyltransferase [Deltaproteobacteria bacterium]|nr:N-acetyltransferase [Deltaproteobacteria bacterium]MBW2120273.1 N-acetyltransferase [Deltaproteobacteria bacterium]